MTPEDIQNLTDEQLQDLHEELTSEIDRRRLAAYPDDFARILGEGTRGYNTGELEELVREVKKRDPHLVWGFLDTITAMFPAGTDNQGRPCLTVEYRDHEGEHSAEIPLEWLRDPAAHLAHLKKRDEAELRRRIAEAERLAEHHAEELRKLREAAPT